MISTPRVLDVAPGAAADPHSDHPERARWDTLVMSSLARLVPPGGLPRFITETAGPGPERWGDDMRFFFAVYSLTDLYGPLMT